MKNPKLIKVILVDNQYFRAGIKSFIEHQANPSIEIVGETDDSNQLLGLLETERPDIMLTDPKMPSFDVVGMSKTIRQLHPHMRIIAISNFAEEQDFYEMFAAGMKGYLPKTASCFEIISAVKKVYSGHFHFCRSSSNLLLKQVTSQISVSKNSISFNLKELDIIAFICKQYTIKKISSELSVSTRTVEQQVKNIREKINAENCVGIAVYAIRHNIVKLEELAEAV